MMTTRARLCFYTTSGWWCQLRVDLQDEDYLLRTLFKPEPSVLIELRESLIPNADTSFLHMLLGGFGKLFSAR